MCVLGFSCFRIFLDFKGNKGTISEKSQKVKPVKLIAKKTPKGWRLNIPPHLSSTGKRQRMYFDSSDEAERHAGPLREKLRKGEAERILPPDQARFAQRAFSVLSGMPLETIVLAAQEYKKRHDQEQNSRSFKAVWKEYVEAAESEKRSDRHVKNLVRTGKRFAALDEILVCNITRHQLDKAMAGSSASYRRAMSREVKAVFNFAKSHKWTAENPLDGVKLKSEGTGEPEIYSPKECEQIMKACAEAEPDLVPAFVAMLFCGVRPDPDDGEITELRWDDILLGRENRIALPADVAKTKRRRSIKLRSNAVAWLRWHISNNGRHKGLLVLKKGTPFKNQLKSVFEKSKVERIHNGLRKSFCSYVVPVDGLDTAEIELGHSGGRELMNRHYRHSTTAKEARAFWRIMPPKGAGKIVAFSKEAA